VRAAAASRSRRALHGGGRRRVSSDSAAPAANAQDRHVVHSTLALWKKGDNSNPRLIYDQLRAKGDGALQPPRRRLLKQLAGGRRR